MSQRAGHSLNLWSRFESVAQGHRGRTAIDGLDRSETYGGLRDRAHGISVRLSRAAHDPGPVLLLFEHVSEAIPAILACCRLGRPYVPVRPDDAPSRISWILENSGAGVVLTEPACFDQARALPGDRIVLLCDRTLEADDTDAPPFETNSPGDLWIIYTSGSTGRPKGVVQTHRNLAQYSASYADRLSISPGDRISLLLSYSSNFANHVIFMALLNGATVCPYDVHHQGIAGLVPWLEEKGVSILVCVPTLFRHAFGSNPDTPTGFQAVRWVMLIGEPVSRYEFEIFERAFPPSSSLCNRYGSTETGTIAWKAFRAGDRVKGSLLPIGEPGEGFDVLLLDEEGHAVSPGAPGEMMARSAYLASRYWQDPERTAEVFFDDPDAPGMRCYRTGDLARRDPGEGLIHLGRKDCQVQVRGYRVEPAEIEEALRTHPAIDDAFVHVQQEDDEDPRMIGYLVCKAPAPTVTALRRYLAERISAVMIPHTFVELDAFPLAPNGKINRLALPRPSGQRPRLDSSFVAPASPFECRLAEMWRELLGVEEIGILDSFFDLGGDSLKAMRLMSRVEAQFGMAPGLELFSKHPMIRTVADWLLHRMTA